MNREMLTSEELRGRPGWRLWWNVPADDCVGATVDEVYEITLAQWKFTDATLEVTPVDVIVGRKDAKAIARRNQNVRARRAARAAVRAEVGMSLFEFERAILGGVDPDTVYVDDFD